MKKLMLLATALTFGFAVSTTTLHAGTCGDGKDGKACCKKGAAKDGKTAACCKKGGTSAKADAKGEASKKVDTKKTN